MHFYTFFVFSHPGYFGKVGMRYFHKTQNKFHMPSLNVDKLWSLLSEQSRDKYLGGKPSEKAPVIDVVQAVSIYQNVGRFIRSELLVLLLTSVRTLISEV